MANQIPPLICIEANGFPKALYKAIKEHIERGALKEIFYGKPVMTRDIISLIASSLTYEE